MPWAGKGYIQADAQLNIQQASKTRLQDAVKNTPNRLSITTENSNNIIVRGTDFCVKFNKKLGVINYLEYNNTTIIPEGHDIRLDTYRAFVNNDKWCYAKWFENGLHKLRNKIVNFSTADNEDGSFSLNFDFIAKANHKTRIDGRINDAHHKLITDKNVRTPQDAFALSVHATWRVYPDGSISLNTVFDSNNHNMDIGRIGWVLPTNKALSHITYYGRGPQDNYPDRKTSQFIGVYKTDIKDMIVPWCKPQDMGNREEVKWCMISNTEGKGALFTCQDSMSIEYLPYSDVEMITASHPYKLKESNTNFLHLDAAVTGLGGASCGPQPLKRDKVKATLHKMNIFIQPIR